MAGAQDMTPAQAIAALDRALKAGGGSISLQRLASPGNTVTASANCPAIVRGYRADELTGGIQQGWSEAIISPASLSIFLGPTVLPAKGDRAVIGGKTRIIESVEPIELAGAVVKIVITVKG